MLTWIKRSNTRSMLTQVISSTVAHIFIRYVRHIGCGVCMFSLFNARRMCFEEWIENVLPRTCSGNCFDSLRWWRLSAWLFEHIFKSNFTTNYLIKDRTQWKQYSQSNLIPGTNTETKHFLDSLPAGQILEQWVPIILQPII